MRCGPETEEGEASGGVPLGECACGRDDFWPFGGVDEGWGICHGEVAVLVMVVDEEVEFVGAMGFFVGCCHAENDFGVVLHIRWGYNTSLIHFDLLVMLQNLDQGGLRTVGDDRTDCQTPFHRVHIPKIPLRLVKLLPLLPKLLVPELIARSRPPIRPYFTSFLGIKDS